MACDLEVVAARFKAAATLRLRSPALPWSAFPPVGFAAPPHRCRHHRFRHCVYGAARGIEESDPEERGGAAFGGGRTARRRGCTSSLAGPTLGAPCTTRTKSSTIATPPTKPGPETPPSSECALASTAVAAVVAATKVGFGLRLAKCTSWRRFRRFAAAACVAAALGDGEGGQARVLQLEVANATRSMQPCTPGPVLAEAVPASSAAATPLPTVPDPAAERRENCLSPVAFRQQPPTQLAPSSADEAARAASRSASS
mmetsp:Transcript_672/g.1457  ORF Transcript_672/g.1457 Transcript_672/m.1457 type:complete len:257 (-) Transcript_672:824-1594(-)